jgi:hypothetical protein
MVSKSSQDGTRTTVERKTLFPSGQVFYVATIQAHDGETLAVGVGTDSMAALQQARSQLQSRPQGQ